MDDTPIALRERLAFLARALRKCPAFADLGEPEIAKIGAVSLESSIPSGEIIYRQGDASAGFYVVVSGRVRLVADLAPDGSGGSSEVIVTAGACFGEMDVLEDSTRPSTAIAAGNVRVVAVDRYDFEKILASTPSVAVAIMKALVNHLSPGDGGASGGRGRVH